MSVALPSPLHGKRYLEEDTNLEQIDPSVAFGAEYNPQKRIRHVVSPSGRCGSAQFHPHPAYTVGASTFAALRALFPSMSDKVIADTLAEFGDNIDAAIKHLNDLQLSTPGTSKEHALQEQHRQGIIPPRQLSPSRPSSGASSGAAASQPSVEDQAKASAPPARTAEEWIDLLVQQMSAASDMPDAKRRAGDVLRAFEQAVMQHSDQQLCELSRENTLLKRAVAIQNSRLQELLSKETEATELKTTVEAAKERIHALEVQNYSLQLHLKRATDAQNASLTPGRTNPDVF